MISLLMGLSLPIAALGIVLFMVYAFRRDAKIFAVAMGLSLAAFLCVIGVLVGKLVEQDGELSLLGSTRYLLFAGAIMIAWFISAWRFRVRLLGAMMMPLALFTLLVAAIEDRSPIDNSPILDLPTVPTYLHLLLMFAFLALVVVAFAGAAMFLVKTRALKGHALTAIDNELPAVVTLKRLMEIPFDIGFPCITLGLALGILYAGSHFSPGWFWNPKVLATLAIWLYYGALFLMRHGGRLSGRTLARGILILFVMTVSSFFFSSHAEILNNELHPAKAPALSTDVPPPPTVPPDAPAGSSTPTPTI